MKNRDLLIAEAAFVNGYRNALGYEPKNLSAIIASVPAPKPVAWRVMVRRADTEWRLYALYENEKSANATRLRIEGDPLQVGVQPVYAEPPAAEINQQLLDAARRYINALQSEGHARNGHIYRPVTRDYQQQLEKAYADFVIAIAAAEKEIEE